VARVRDRRRLEDVPGVVADDVDVQRDAGERLGVVLDGRGLLLLDPAQVVLVVAVGRVEPGVAAGPVPDGVERQEGVVPEPAPEPVGPVPPMTRSSPRPPLSASASLPPPRKSFPPLPATLSRPPAPISLSSPRPPTSRSSPPPPLANTGSPVRLASNESGPAPPANRTRVSRPWGNDWDFSPGAVVCTTTASPRSRTRQRLPPSSLAKFSTPSVTQTLADMSARPSRPSTAGRVVGGRDDFARRRTTRQA
jgi:hypothetical protein